MSQRQPRTPMTLSAVDAEAGLAASTKLGPVNDMVMITKKPELTANTSLVIGDKGSHTTTITREMVEQFAQLTGDHNPIHVDPETGKASLFGTNIVHGMLVGSLYGPVIVNQLVGPGCIYRKQSLEFEAPVPVGEAVTSIVLVKDAIHKPDKVIYVLETETCLANGGKRVLKGEAVIMVLLPKDTE